MSSPMWRHIYPHELQHSEVILKPEREVLGSRTSYSSCFVFSFFSAVPLYCQVHTEWVLKARVCSGQQPAVFLTWIHFEYHQSQDSIPGILAICQTEKQKMLISTKGGKVNVAILSTCISLDPNLRNAVPVPAVPSAWHGALLEGSGDPDRWDVPLGMWRVDGLVGWGCGQPERG